MIEWNGDPVIFQIKSFAPRWYGMMFFLGFLAGHHYLHLNFTRLGRSQKDTTKLFTYVFIGTVVGARLGHCFFYAPSYYFSHLPEVFMIWKGGLASHGGYLGVMFLLWLFAKQSKGITFLEVADIIGPSALLTGAFARVGNFFNSEIIGKETDLPWAIIFKRVDNIPRHPSQLYEAIGYFSIAFLLFQFNRSSEWRKKAGSTVGLLLILSFIFRFLIEYTKENQVSFENGMFMNMGQILSIPMVGLGVVLMMVASKKATR